MDIAKKALASEVRCVRAYVSKLEKVLSDLSLYPRNPPKIAFDSMALQSINKSFALCKAALLLINKGFPDEAYATSRSLVECSLNLRYITSEPDKQEERTKEFIYYDEIEQNYWLDQARKHLSDPTLLQEIEASDLAKRLDAKHINPNSAFLHWSKQRGYSWEFFKGNHSLDGTTNSLQQRAMAYAVDYHAPSQYVHCSQRGLNNYFHDPKYVYAVNTHRAVSDNTAPKVLRVLYIYLHLVVCYSLFGMNMDRPDKVNALFQKVLDRVEMK